MSISDTFLRRFQIQIKYQTVSTIVYLLSASRNRTSSYKVRTAIPHVTFSIRLNNGFEWGSAGIWEGQSCNPSKTNPIQNHLYNVPKMCCYVHLLVICGMGYMSGFSGLPKRHRLGENCSNTYPIPTIARTYRIRFVRDSF